MRPTLRSARITLAPLTLALHDGLHDHRVGRRRLLVLGHQDEPGTTRSLEPHLAVAPREALMPVTGKSLGWLLTEAVSDLPESRQEAASVAVDWETAMSEVQKRLVVRVLSLLASTERPGSVRETQLNTISNLFLPPVMTRADVAPLFEIPPDSLDAQDVDYLDGLLESLADFPETPEAGEDGTHR